MTKRGEKSLDDAWNALARGRTSRARMLARRAAREPGLEAEALHVLGRADLDDGRPERALEILGRAVEKGGDWPDLHYDIGLAHEALGNERERVAAFLKVRDMDPAFDRELPDFLDEDALVEAAEETLAGLPPEILQRLGTVPILVEDRPERHLVEEGFDPRALGLFDGPPWSEQGLTGPALNRIVLYRMNIAAVARNAEEAREEVRITLLHETAHFFGLDENEVAALGLE